MLTRSAIPRTSLLMSAVTLFLAALASSNAPAQATGNGAGGWSSPERQDAIGKTLERKRELDAQIAAIDERINQIVAGLNLAAEITEAMRGLANSHRRFLDSIVRQKATCMDARVEMDHLRYVLKYPTWTHLKPDVDRCEAAVEDGRRRMRSYGETLDALEQDVEIIRKTADSLQRGRSSALGAKERAAAERALLDSTSNANSKIQQFITGY